MVSGAVVAALLAAAASPLQAQIRVATYNTLDRPVQSQHFAPWEVVLEAIGDQQEIGIAKRIGVMALQEVTVPDTSAQNVAGILNGIYGVSSYHAISAAYGDGFNLQSIVYDSSQVELIGAPLTFGMGTRPGFRARFRPVGYDSSAAEFYVYSIHLKAFPGFEDQRGAEASALRHNGNLLGPSANLIFAGDFNLTSGSSEPAYSNMLSSGNGQAIDPENPGSLPDPASFHDPLKMSYSSSGAGSRIDFQFISTEMDDGEGLDLVNGSYRVFNRDRVGSRVVTVPEELISASDHLPVVADYQLPAWMNVVAESVPEVLMLGEDHRLDFTVSNVAPVSAILGADELDYTLGTIGAIGSFVGPTVGMDPALGGGVLHQLALDTSTPGPKSGSLLVTSASAAVQNGIAAIDVEYHVITEQSLGDLNWDGRIDLADLNLVNNNWDPSGTVPHSYWQGDVNRDGRVDLSDSNLLLNNWAPGGYAPLSGGIESAMATTPAVPEPSTAALLSVGLCAFGFVSRRRMSARNSVNFSVDTYASLKRQEGGR